MQIQLHILVNVTPILADRERLDFHA